MVRSTYTYIVTIVVGLLLTTTPSWARRERDTTQRATDSTPPIKSTTLLRSWTMNRDFGWHDSVTVDTNFYNLHNRNMRDDYYTSSSFNGNLASPVQSQVWFERKRKSDFLFQEAYAPYIITAQDVRFFETNCPFSTIAYRHGFLTYHDENDLQFLFAGNINRRTNIGASINFTHSVGAYDNTAAKLVNGTIFTSVLGNNYKLHAAFVFNNLTNYENGGVQNSEDVGDKHLKPYDLPTNISAISKFKSLTGYLNHSYSICVEREENVHYRERDEDGKWEERDSFKTNYIPVFTFAHAFELNGATKRYKEKSYQGYYDTVNVMLTGDTTVALRNEKETRDSTKMLLVSNVLSFTLNEEFNRHLHFGFTALVRYDAQRYSFRLNECDINHVLPPIDNSYTDLKEIYKLNHFPDTTLAQAWQHNFFIGGAIYKHLGRFVKYDFDAEVCMAGYKIGDYFVNGHLTSTFPVGKFPITISAHASMWQDHPTFFEQDYQSNHYEWHNQFKNIYRYSFGGAIVYPTKWLYASADISFENIRNYIYYPFFSNPKQDNNNRQIFAIDAHLNVLTPWVNLDNHVVYQHSSEQAIIPLPDVVEFHNLYYHGTWFKYLDVQGGVDMRMFTQYYAPVLNPAIGQFAVQQDKKVGLYPIIDLYLNLYLRQLRLAVSVQYSHFNKSFMPHTTYFSMPNYPYNPGMFKLAFHWHFYK